MTTENKNDMKITYRIMGHLLGFFGTLLLILQLRLCSSAGTITPNRSIADGDVLISGGQIFALGFFSPGNSNSRYVGIWYYKISEQTVVWVANRDNPVNDSSGVLSIDGAGNLIIYSNSTHSSHPIWSTNVSAPLSKNASVVAQLLDSGNLVLIHRWTQKVLWQSFDYPTNTLLPFMKLGLDRKTRLNRFLTSWRSGDDPGTGSYSAKLDFRGCPQFFIYNGSQPLFRGGPWNGLRWSGVPQMSINFFIFNVSFVNDEDEIYAVDMVRNSSILSRMVVDESGNLRRFTWHERNRRWVQYLSNSKEDCDNYAHCGAYGYCDPYNNVDEFVCRCLPGFEPRSPRDWYLRDGSGGCLRKRAGLSMCGNGEGFVRLQRVKVPDTSTARVETVVSGKACEEACLRNCSCMAYAAADVRGGGSGCITWHGALVDTRAFSDAGQELYVRIDAVELELANKSSSFRGKKRTVVIVIATVIGVLLLSITLVYCLHHRFSTGLAGRRSNHKMLLFNIATTRKDYLEEIGSEGSRSNVDLPFFKLRDIRYATDNFSNKLGDGGFGAVFKGQLSNGQEIAVKRLSKHSSQGAEEFKNEVLLIARLQHRNLVKLIGCCIEEEETMLIYEYMPNKSLDSFIFDQTRRAMLDWKRRYEIILGIARGILYLHQDSRLKIIHRDLKAGNILLDRDMNPKISDFGMARIFGGNQTQANTTRVVGTFGYMSPEYALDGIFSMKSDVFSFGVLLLEIVAGKKNTGFYNDDPLSNLIRHVWDLWNEDRALEIVDSSVGDSQHDHEVLWCIHVGLLCVQESAMDRPTMSSVVFMLSNEGTLPLPKQPGFAFKKSNRHQHSSTSGLAPCSVDDATITVIDPR